jgi:serine phosphatase RsbU (regulator of sigma subunit)
MSSAGSGERPVARLLRLQQVAEPDAIVETLSAALAGVSANDVVLFLIDYAQVELTPHPDVLAHAEDPRIASLDGSMAGRAFTSALPLAAERDDGWHVWVPVSEQANRLGVLAMTMPAWNAEVEELCIELGLAAATLLMASEQYSDLAHRLRRRKDMTLAAEMQWSLLPPLSFATGGVTVAGLLEPAYEVGGDCFDYAYNNGVLEFAVMDMVGHGLTSATLASLLVGAYRHGRRAGQDLPNLAISIDHAARSFPGPPTFATALLGHVTAATGRLRWLTCGHPQPIIARENTTLSDLEITIGVPVGLGALGPVVGSIAEVDLQPGDGVLIYTDGVVEARTPTGDFFGEQRLRDLLSREHAAGGTPQEVVRRLVRNTLEHSEDHLRDDASMLYIRWDGPKSA